MGDDRSRGWQPLTSLSSDDEIVSALQDAINRVRFAPGNNDVRRRLRAVAGLPALRERAVGILREEVRRALTDEPDAAAVFLEVLVRMFETLDRPVEAVAAMDQLVALVPDNVEHLQALASRCVSLGAVQKAAEAFERIGMLANKEQATAAYRSAGKLYRENGQPERAADAYRAVLAHRPEDKEAWRNLEELLEQLGRWQELADVRGELARRSSNTVDKATLLRGQARALLEAGDGAGATEAMVAAAQLLPDDLVAVLDHADMLARTGQGANAAALLAARIEDAATRATSPDDLAGLRLRYAIVLDDACGDRASAATVLDELLVDHPMYGPALERLVWLASHDPNPVVHARALERYAAATEDPGAQATAYAEAGRRYREARELDSAIRAFEQAAEIVDGVREELEEVRATIDLQRAAQDISSGDTQSAERRLRAVLEVRPFDVDANIALADLLIATNNLTAAREHLQQLLASAPDDALPKRRLAPLAHKCAMIVAATGDTEEAHRLLHEAHLLDRHSLPITLDLGQSCVERKLWRQAILYLAPLAEHPDAPRHAARVAQALVHAGHAEIRALRPANAIKHFEAAVRLDPKCPPAWHALGADAMENGDLVRAIECFEREAVNTTDPADRARLYEALGDLALEVMSDPKDAERYWSKAADGNVDVLRKLLASQRERNADLEMAETCVRLAAADKASHRELMLQAADVFAASGDFVRAREAAEALMATYPFDIDAVNSASGIVLTACDADTAAAWLERALESWASGRSRDPRQAELWRRLGDVERSRQRNTEAKTAYQRAVEIGGDSNDAIEARRALMQLAPKATTLESLEVLVEAEQSPEEMLQLARAYLTADRLDDARAIFDVARALELPLTAEDEQFMTQTAPRPMAFDEAYGGALDEATHHAVIDDPNEGPLAALLDILAEAYSRLAPDPNTALRRAGMEDATRLSATSYATVGVLYPKVSKALGGPATLQFTHPSVGDDVRVVLASPPVIVIGDGLAAVRAVDGDAKYDPLLRFKVGRVVELARARRAFAAGVDAEAFALMVAALRHAFAPQPNVDPTVADEAKRVHGAIPVTLRGRVSELLAATPPQAMDANAYLVACQRAADRSGLLASGNATVAIKEVSDRPSLVRFAVSKAYRTTRRGLRARAR